MVKRDVDVKNEIVAEARARFDGHIKAINARLGGQFMPHISPSFSEAMKSRRSYASMLQAVDAELAIAKVEANLLAARIEANHKSLLTNDTVHLFPDFASVCTKAREDFAALHAMRIQQEAVRDADRKRALDLTANNQTQFEDQGGKADAARAEIGPQELRQQPESASTPPIPQHEHAAYMDGAPSMITEFIALQACSPAEKKAMRAAIEKWELYRVKTMAARGLAAA